MMNNSQLQSLVSAKKRRVNHHDANNTSTIRRVETAITRLQNLPFACCHLPVIANPLDENELLIFKKQENNELGYIYMVKQQQCKKFPQRSQTSKKLIYPHPAPECVINGTNKNEIYSFGKYQKYFGIWNVEEMNWKSVSLYENINLIEGNCMKFKEFYIFIHENTCTIYQLSLETQDMKKIAEFNGLKNSSFSDAGRSIILPSNPETKENNQIEILFCGFNNVPFIESFESLTINFNNEEIKFKHNDNPSIFTKNIEKELNQIIEKDTVCCYFSMDLIENRYLVFVGGIVDSLPNNMSNKIFYFDFFQNKWIVSNHAMPTELCFHSSCIVKNSDCFHIMGGLDIDCEDLNTHFCINLGKILPRMPIRWENERQLWIGFIKNKENQECLIDQIPKDVLLYVLSFLQ